MNKFEDKLQRLDTIVNALQRNEVSLDEAIALFEEGLHLSKELDGQLKNYELKINELTLKDGDNHVS
ncbi:MAG: exodeoxyribonuclease VII small subunit [Erysipelotrichaceae bacterium]